MTPPGRPPDLTTLGAIAQAIALGANQLLPSDFAASEADGDIEVRIRGEAIGRVGVAGILRDRRSGISLDDVATVAQNALSWFQDLVSEDSSWPWPPVSGKARGCVASCRAVAGYGWLRLWFEADGQPVTTVVEVPLPV